MNLIGEPWQRCLKKRKLTPLVRERLSQLKHPASRYSAKYDAAYDRENSELVKDKETLTCALEYARKNLNQTRENLFHDLDRDRDDITTPHLAIVAGNAIAAMRAEIARLKKRRAKT